MGSTEARSELRGNSARERREVSAGEEAGGRETQKDGLSLRVYPKSGVLATCEEQGQSGVKDRRGAARSG